MLTIKKDLTENQLLVTLSGRLDTTTAPDLEKELTESIPGVEELIFDIEELEYVSSAGLRVFLSSQKKMNKQGSMKITKASQDVKEIFDVTGFSDILTIE